MIFTLKEQQQYQNRKKVYLLSMFLLLILIGCAKFPDLGDGYRLDYDGRSEICILDTKNTIIIDSRILDYAFNENFIIVSQRPWDIFYSIPKANYKIRRELFKKSTFYQVYIIVKKKKLVLGPFNKEQYLLKKKELGIPEELKLSSIEK